MAEENCERLVALEVELLDEMEANDMEILILESGLEAVFTTAAEAQVELESVSLMAAKPIRAGHSPPAKIQGTGGGGDVAAGVRRT
ncbi:unnamed protein product [Mesocestoides corti]|uniref:Uncharacterized protein n=1 Tax=Mesocestoides corti TaxID=53468 RepID=A0A0R3UBA3_MESCO|nr:unnamed protein product [Mesocestoides corti]